MDIFTGNLLTDYSQNAKDNIDRQRNRVPDLEDLLRQIELDEIAADVTKTYKSEGGEEEGSQQCEEGSEDCVVEDSNNDNDIDYMPDIEEESEE